MVRRELGTGRWDKILMRRMVDLSYADNYEEAKEEWIATGDVWWNGNGDVPEWVSQNNHPNQCLCGHNIVYHFRIRNTITDAEEIVGSDHINSYLIMRQIAEEMQKDIAQVTDAEVERWLKERVGSMKAEAWWKENGDSFSSMFNKVKELDCFLNVRSTNDTFWDKELGRYTTKTILRKRGEGKMYSRNYKMASIVWRWNHPENPNNQLTNRGTPTDKLMADLSYLYIMYDTLYPRFTAYKEKRAALIAAFKKRTEEDAARRLKQREEQRLREEARVEQRRLAKIKWEEERPMREAKEKIAEEKRKKEREIAEANRTKEMNGLLDADPTPQFIENCRFLGIPVLYRRVATDYGELLSLYRFKAYLSDKAKDGFKHVRPIRTMLRQTITKAQIKVLEELGVPRQEIIRLEVEETTRIKVERKIEQIGEKE